MVWCSKKAHAHIPVELFDPKREILIFVDYCEESKGHNLIRYIQRPENRIFMEDSEERSNSRWPN